VLAIHKSTLTKGEYGAHITLYRKCKQSKGLKNSMRSVADQLSCYYEKKCKFYPHVVIAIHKSTFTVCECNARITYPSLSHHKIQTSEIIDTRLENGRTTSNVILVLSFCAMLSSCKAREQKPTGLLAPDPFLTCERAWKAMENYYALS
jgi:hypothetical protein